MWSGTWSVAATRIGLWTWIWSTRHCGLGQRWVCSWGKFIERCWGWLSLLNWICVLNYLYWKSLPPRKLEPWFVLWSFFLLRLLCITINLPYMEYCCHVWGGASSCYSELLEKQQKRTCKTVGSSLAAFLEPLAYRRNVTSLSLFYRYYFGKFSSEPAELVSLPYFWGRSTRYFDILHNFSLTIPRCYKDFYDHSFFFRIARLCNSLSIECFALIHDPNGFESRINRHLLTVDSF